MLIHTTSHFMIYFGDAGESIATQEIAEQKNAESIGSIAQRVQASQVVFLRQEHGIVGMHVKNNDENNYFFMQTGDYLFTQKKGCGIGVVTADCLPIVVHDPVTNVIGVIHAGWRGLAAGIVQTALQNMIDVVGMKLDNVEIIIGPGARVCCYEVQPSFIDNFMQYENWQDFFVFLDNTIYFDAQAFVTILARNLGIGAEKIYTTYNVCTICNPFFCSYRREKENARRQITMVCLR